LNYQEIASKKFEELTAIEFISEKNQSLKSLVITSFIEESGKEALSSEIQNTYQKIIQEINENSSIQLITKNKKDEDISNLLHELIEDHKEQCNLKKIESLEQKLINNLDENSYSELIKLKSQINRE
jgi:hypothetical protein